MNNEALMLFKTWLVERPELAESGFVESVNNHREGSTTLWWAGPQSDFRDRVLNEANARGINAIIHIATYSRSALRRASSLIFEAREPLAAVKFVIGSISAFDGQHDGLRVNGYDPSQPELELSQSTRTAVHAVLREIDGLAEVMALSDIVIAHGGRIVLY